MGRGLLLAVLLLAGCAAPLPPTPQDLQAKRFETLPDKGVIYVVRPLPDFSDDPTPITLGDFAQITTYPGTYYRWEVEPGVHRIDGFGVDNGRIAVRAEAGRLYFVEQRVSSFFRNPQSFFALIPEPHGRAAVSRAELVP
jgi:hypothetical protein